ncbi:PadR family transcriptional regulator [Murinocardiopsis flavida]|uniref:PadR family transcriptional regulator n=1 Tax=Murinocardiopsis flavida TaxID=645275 RepID=A0A2P8CUU5_9ACTN|nr:helix-turn-helix transcriptional regulator [Murinocardiopsis flavida]PSK88728.1 PadR family transcriptional regulator [Murinocardiopsis flavida]
MHDVKITITVAKVLKAFLEDASAPRYGFDLMRDTQLASGTLYPILARLEKAEWLTSEFEDIDEEAEGRPARRFYTITANGASSARIGLAELHAQIWPGARRFRLGHQEGTA